MPFPDETPRSAAATGTEQDNLFTRQARAEGRRKGRLPSPCPHKQLRGMACIVPGQDNKALPQLLSYGNPDRLLSLPVGGEVRHQGVKRLIRRTPVLKEGSGA